MEPFLKSALEPLATRFKQLHDKAVEETNVARSQEPFDRNLLVCAEFGKIFVEAEEIIRSSALLKTEEERNWVRASFVSAYLAGTQSNYFNFITLMDSCVPSIDKVMKAIQNTVPGDIRTLIIAARHLAGAGPITEALQRDVSEQAREACIRVFGRHSEDDIKALIIQHSKCYLF